MNSQSTIALHASAIDAVIGMFSLFRIVVFRSLEGEGSPMQFSGRADGVIPLPQEGDGALRVSSQAFNTFFCNFCLGSNEA